jgi:hypothetical protein
MNSSRRLQVTIAVVALAAAGVVLMLMVKRKPPAQVLPSEIDVAPPKLIELRASVDATIDGGWRAVEGSPKVSRGEVVDFRIEVADLCFVYVFAVEHNVARLEWLHPQYEPAWEPGVYAPEWGSGGLHFSQPGPVELFAVSSPVPISDISKWDFAALQEAKSRCPHCGVSSVRLDVHD